MATSGAAVKLRRLRQRFGISAPKVSVRTHLPWYWKVFALTSLLLVAFVVGRWVYDAGRSIGGYDSSSSLRTIDTLERKLVALETELASVRAAADMAGSNIAMARAAQEKLLQQVKGLEAENLALKQDLAFFEGLLPEAVAGEAGVRINRLRLEKDGLGEQYRYRMLVTYNGSRQQREFRGELQFSLKVQAAGKDAMIVVPPEEGAGRDGFRLEVKHFQRVEGVLPVPAGAALKSVEVRILSDGVVRARQTINL